MKIKDLAASEKPRERLINYGAENLSNAELLAILINTGRKNTSCLGIANELLQSVDVIKDLKMLSINELTHFKGIGIYKAVILKAALELGDRMHSGMIEQKTKVTNPSDVADFMMGKMQHLTQEQLVVLFLNAKNVIVRQKVIFIGTLTASVIHPREIFSEAIRWACHSIVVLHNHPSGDSTPSEEDILTTERLIQCGEVLGIKLLDHIIIGNNRYTSLLEKGLIGGCE